MQSERTCSVISILLIAILSSGCSRPPADGSGSSIETIAPNMITEGSDIEKLFEEVLATPTDPTLRKQLAEGYAAEGHRVVSEFFLATAAVADGRDFDIPPRRADPLFCKSETLDGVDAESERIANTIAAGQYTEAFAIANDARERFGSSCVFLAQWASAAIWSAAVSPSSVTRRDQETAVRLLILLSESGLYPRTALSLSSVYETLGFFFMAKDDNPSAYVAFHIAKDRLLDQGEVPSDTSRRNQRITDLIKKIEPKLPKKNR
jgi:hypothetical protein